MAMTFLGPNRFSIAPAANWPRAQSTIPMEMMSAIPRLDPPNSSRSGLKNTPKPVQIPAPTARTTNPATMTHHP